MKKSTRLCFIGVLLLLGGALRFAGLQFRINTSDEEHYRADASNTLKWIKVGHFRDHSVRHQRFFAPHGLAAQLGTAITARVLSGWFGRFLPEQPAARDNILGRAFFAGCGVLLLPLLYVFARRLSGPRGALLVLLIGAISPLLILWSRSEYLDAPLALFALSAFYCAWRSADSSTLRSAFFFASGCGLLAGLALATKWSGVVLLPFIPLSIAWSQKGIAKFPSRKLLFLFFTWLGALLATVFSFLTPESWSWAFFPVHGLPYGDSGMGIRSSLAQSFSNLASLNNWGALLLNFGGPCFIFLLGLAMTRWKAPDTLHEERRFLWVLLLSACAFTVAQESALFCWRGYFLTTVAILFLAPYLEEQKAMRPQWLVALLLVTTLPLSIREGLRLAIPLIHYHGDNHTLHENAHSSLDSRQLD